MSRYFVLPEEGIGPGGDIIFRKLTTADALREALDDYRRGGSA